MTRKQTEWNVEDTECSAVPFEALQGLLVSLEYGSPSRVIVEMLALTGCRCASIDRMRIDRVYEGVLYWHEGKSTRGLRRERLPEWYWDELVYYREHYDVRGVHLFGLCWASWRKQWERFVRPVLPVMWQERRLVPFGSGWREEYVLQLKGLRKTFQTAEFYRQLARWRDAGVALQMTSKRMRHSSERITAHHYIKEFGRLDPRDLGVSPAVALRGVGRQQRLLDYMKSK
jgi:hypothetical protein